MENPLERRVLQSCSVDISRDPIVVKDGGSNLFMVHVIRGTGNASIVPPTLPDEFEKVVDAGQDIVHENDGIKVFSLCVSKFMQRHKCAVAHLGQVLNTVIERPSSAHGGADHHSHANAPRQGVENAEKGFSLIC